MRTMKTVKRILGIAIGLMIAGTSMTVNAAQVSDLSGLPVKDEVFVRRPVTVMIDNTTAACPQSGISQADIVYEAYVEGNITRLMCVFENYDGMTKIGPIRSIRDYFIHWACEYDPIMIHYGGPDLYVKTYYDLQEVNNLNGTKLEGTASYRSSDRKAPHNAYTGAKYIANGVKKMGYSAVHTQNYQGKHFQFTSEAVALKSNQGIVANEVKPGFTVNTPVFTYNPKDGKYYRSQYGKPHVDKENGVQLSFDNVIIQFADTVARDAKGYLWTQTLDTGKLGYFIADGRAVPVTWVKNSLTGVTHFYGTDGLEIKLNPGKTMICVVPTDKATGVSIK